jgi:hypothetical protein
MTRLDIPIDKNTTALRAKSAAGLLSDGLTAMEEFIQRH